MLKTGVFVAALLVTSAAIAHAQTATPQVCNRDALATHLVTPDMPQVARARGATGTAQIKVMLDETGKVTGAAVWRSSGSEPLDAAAIKAAPLSKYTP